MQVSKVDTKQIQLQNKIGKNFLYREEKAKKYLNADTM